jgi:intraflagellar transport protein 140
MQELRQRVPSLNMSFYVNARTIEVIHKALDIPLDRNVQQNVIANGDGGGSEDEGEILDEAVDEDLQNGFD